MLPCKFQTLSAKEKKKITPPYTMDILSKQNFLKKKKTAFLK
jgi:hypothetical protein